MKSYQEYFNPDRSLRDQYIEFQKKAGLDLASISVADAKTLIAPPINDELRLFPFPLVLHEEEYQQISKGCQQRAIALQCFFQDIILGEGKVWQEGLLEKDFIDHVLSDENLPLEKTREIWKGYQHQDITFVYGPDLNRNSAGEWRVTEDNIGRIGGNGITSALMNKYCQHFKMRPVFQAQEKCDYQYGIKKFLEYRDRQPHHPEVLGLGSFKAPGASMDYLVHAYNRRYQLIKEMGIRTLAYEELTSEDRERILSGHYPFLVNMDVKWRPKKELYGVLMKNQGVKMLDAPLAKTMCNKGFLPYVETLIDFYLSEEPILKTQPSEFVTKPSQIDMDGDFVYKVANEQNGIGVYLNSVLNTGEKREAKKILHDWLVSNRVFIKQELMAPSVLPCSLEGGMDEYFVELRPMSFVYGKKAATVTDTPHARAVSVLGDPRAHFVRGALNVVVFRV